jgi:fructokinase
MTRDDPFEIRTDPPPAVVGTGLMALDLVVSESTSDRREWLGGTCGNVLTILAYLGWRALPVARLAPGPAADRIRAEMARWRVSDEFVAVTDDGSTPVIIERITRGTDGKPRHSFSWRCPGCGNPFPSYKPVLVTAADDLAPRIGPTEVFFFDRVSAGAIQLARTCSERGALVVFEPSGVGNPVQFRQAWAAAHVVKYSHERLSDLPAVAVSDGPLLQIETLGEAGLRYRFRPRRGRGSGWVESPPFAVADLRDSAGAGDWCTAGLIHRLSQAGVTGFLRTGTDDLRDAIRFGQAMAAWNCRFEGARGGMDVADVAEFRSDVLQILAGGQSSSVTAESSSVGGRQFTSVLCVACGESSRSSKPAKRAKG